jgi:hypothetical protein
MTLDEAKVQAQLALWLLERATEEYLMHKGGVTAAELRKDLGLEETHARGSRKGRPANKLVGGLYNRLIEQGALKVDRTVPRRHLWFHSSWTPPIEEETPPAVAVNLGRRVARRIL